MDNLDFGISPSKIKAAPQKGRRAPTTADSSWGTGATDQLIKAPSETTNSSSRANNLSGLPGGRKRGGWANSARGGGFGPPQEDARFKQDDDSDSEMPVIPDLDEVVEEDFTQQVAQAPSVAVNRVATYRELDSDLLRHAAFSTLDDIDLRLLTNNLVGEADVREPDIEWQWDALFTEVSSELLYEWEPAEESSEREETP